MQLICIDGKDKKDAMFIEINSNELIKGIGVKWNGDEINWNHGDYMGKVKTHIKIVKED